MPEEWIINDDEMNPFEEFDKITNAIKEPDIDLVIATIKSLLKNNITEEQAAVRILKVGIDKEDFRRFLKVFKAGRQYEKRRITDALRELEEML